MMIEELKELTDRDRIRFNDDSITDFTETDKMRVNAVRCYSSDDSELVIVELEDFFLVAHTFDGDTKYFVYQMMDSGTAEELETDGYCFLTEDFDFRSKIVNRDDTRSYVYKHSAIGAIYEMSIDRDDYEIEDITSSSICEYICSSHYLNHILIEKTDMGNHFSDIELNIYQGFEVKESSIDLI